MEEEVKKFIDDNCHGCEYPCEKGIVETSEFIRCIDKNITIEKNKKDDKENFQLKLLLFKLGIYSNLQGYHYIWKAVDILRKQKIHTKITTIYKMIYKKIENSTSPSAVERAIRHAITSSYKKNESFKKLYPKVPSNSEFLYDLIFNIDIFKKEYKI